MTARNVHEMHKIALVDCQVCGSRQDLHRHHIVPRSRTQNDDPENLIVLCEAHHKAAHNHTIDLGLYVTAAQGAKAVLLTGTVYAAYRLLYPSEHVERRAA